MGCAGSREARLDRRRSPPPFGRSLSLPVVRGSNKGKGGGFHIVSLASSTLGSLGPDRNNQDSSDEEMMKVTNDRNRKLSMDFVVFGGGEVEDPAELESETINAWELMEGLEDDNPLSLRPSPAAGDVDRSFSFNAIHDSGRVSPEPPAATSKSSNLSTAGSPKPFWMQSAAGESVQFDPDVISNFQKAMTELSPQKSALRRSPVRYRPDEIPKFPGIVKARVAAFQEQIDARRGIFKSNGSSKASTLKKSLPQGKGKLVLYLTSIRGVRKTYEDCLNVNFILQGYGVRIDERDVSMHGGFRDELNKILGHGYGGGRLPRIFANGRYLGGADEVMQMHDAGDLGAALKECEMAVPTKGCGGVICEDCGDHRFVPCQTCSGSCKVFVEEEEEEIGGFRRCQNCNENGLIRCPLCCY